MAKKQKEEEVSPPMLGECRRYPPHQIEDDENDDIVGYEFTIVPETCGCHECRKKTSGHGEFCGNCKCWHVRDDLDGTAIDYMEEDGGAGLGMLDGEVMEIDGEGQVVILRSEPQEDKADEAPAKDGDSENTQEGI